MTRMLFFVVLSGCGGASKEARDDTAVVPQDTSSCEDVYTWTTVGAPFVTTWCTPCHSPELLDTADRQGAPLNVVIDSPQTVRQWASVIALVIRSEDEDVRMPPAGGPTEEELLAFEEWLDCGAPE